MTSDDRGRGAHPSGVYATELWLLVAVLVCGLVVRVGHLSATSIEHFDEGVYASNVWFEAYGESEYPDRHLYAPPLLPWLIESSIALFGPGQAGTMLPSLLAGCVILPLVWWVGRSWFGAQAGLAAAALAAFSDFHALYSRTALTDVLLCFWILLSVFAIWKCLVGGQLRWMAAAGLAVGLAWWTKYNGWLPLAIGLAGLVAWLVFGQRPAMAPVAGREKRAANKQAAASDGKRLSAGSCLLRWAGVAVIAGLVWSPVLVVLQPVGGYSVVAANHGRYVVGMGGWLDSSVRQAGSHQHLSGVLSCAGLGVAVLLATALGRRLSSTWNQSFAPDGSQGPETATDLGLPLSIAVAVFLTGLAALCGVFVVLVALAGLGILLELTSPLMRTRGQPPVGSPLLQTWLLAAWFLSLCVVTPLYSPYPRLTLPWLVASWIGSGAMITRIGALPAAGSAQSGQRRMPRSVQWIVGLACIVVGGALLVAGGTHLASKGMPAWQSRTGIEEAARQMIEDIRHSTEGLPRDPAVAVDYVVYVYGEPGLFFHLSRFGTEGAIRPARSVSFDSQPVPTYLAIGPHALRSDAFRQEWATAESRFELIGTYPARLSDLVLLNHYAAESLQSNPPGPEDELRVYLLQ